ncbi:MAG: D-glycero-D-manno-heptose 1,7-bisphosphate phosphatase [Alteromonadaceae bacterium]
MKRRVMLVFFNYANENDGLNNINMKKALFLDRDGIINVDHGYVYKSNDFEFVEGIFELCATAIEKEYDIFVITNQAGIARGLYTIADFEKLTVWMEDTFKRKGITLKKVYFCPHHPLKGNNEFKQICQCRKPQPGMIMQAHREFNIDLANSILIGDKASDILAAQAAGIGTQVLVESKYTEDVEVSAYRVKDVISARAYL